MLLLLSLVAIPLGIAAWFVAGESWWRRRRRAALARQPFPAQWQDWLRARTSIYARVPPELRSRLHELTRIFVGEKSFVGCNGLTVTEEMRVVIAAYACLLVMNRPDVPRSHFYDDLFSILVYPTPFIVPHTQRDGHGLVTEGHRVLSGQAWDSRRIIVSWQDIEDGLTTGHNVVLHAPGLGSARAYRDWSKVFWEEYDRLRVALGAGQPTFLDPYAATAPAEFFAVVTEAFFEKPRELEQQHAGLYEQLRRYYRVDPARW